MRSMTVLQASIKAKKGTQYEYPVSEIKETEPLNYDRIIMNGEIKWTMPSESEDSSISHEIIMEKANFYYTIPFYILSSEIATKDIVEVFDVTENSYNKAESLYENYFIKNKFRKICRLQNLEIVLTWIHEKTNGGKEFWDNHRSFIFPW